jgi:hypothetical protein
MREAANLDDKNEKHIVTPGRSLPACKLLGDISASQPGGNLNQTWRLHCGIDAKDRTRTCSVHTPASNAQYIWVEGFAMQPLNRSPVIYGP